MYAIGVNASMMSLASRSIGLCDCNNFFVSCERRENPALEQRPVVVLSGNDGCVVARSNEVKAMGVPMGVPYFKVRELLERNRAVVLSGRLSLYNRISAEVMGRLARFSDATEVYSIDEGFLNLAVGSITDPQAYCDEIRSDIRKHCGIPVSIGISATKTLAKLASNYAKHTERGVHWIDDKLRADSAWMSQFPLSEVWGIGRRSAEKFASFYNIRTAADLIQADDLVLKDKFSVNALYTAWELRGFSVFPVSTVVKPPKSIQVSRSFGDAVYSYDELLEAVLYFTMSAARQLRAAGQRASRMGLFIATNRFQPENYYLGEEEKRFSSSKALDQDFLIPAKFIFDRIFRPGCGYKKAGVLLCDFSDVTFGVQQQLFCEEAEKSLDERQLTAASVSDGLNREFGRIVIASADNYGAPGRGSRWYPKREHAAESSAHYDKPQLPLYPHRRVGF